MKAVLKPITIKPTKMTQILFCNTSHNELGPIRKRAKIMVIEPPSWTNLNFILLSSLLARYEPIACDKDWTLKASPAIFDVIPILISLRLRTGYAMTLKLTPMTCIRIEPSERRLNKICQ
jgi:hypothetical protein